MTDAIRQFRRYLDTHDRLIQEVRLPNLDPATDKSDECCIGGYTFSLLMAANALLAHSDDELESELPDLRAVAEQLLARVEKLGG
jgi:hypothetical protein